jgi:transcriptional regulator with XRE-family HTH domain
VSESDPWQAQREALGSFIRTQRQLANLSLREMAELAKVSNPYLSQVERGLHAPSVRVLTSIARALNLSADILLAQAGFDEDDAKDAETGDDEAGPSRPPARPDTETAIRTDPALTPQQKETLLAVYRSYVGSGGRGAT